MGKNMVKQLINFYRNQEGFSLIVVIFSMMILAILGWTLVNLFSSNFEMNTRSLESERALYLAEAGKEWALMQLLNNNTWNTSVDRDCNHTNEWRTFNLTGGQFAVCCRGNRTDEDANCVFEISGYAPNATKYLARRNTKILIRIGSMSTVVQAKNLFNWSGTTVSSAFNGEIISGHYEGTDPDSVQDQPADLDVPGSGNRTFAVAGTFPQIDMDYFLTNANYVWNLTRESNITAINGNNITVADPIFTAGDTWVNETAVRNLRIGGWSDASWRRIARRNNLTGVRLGTPSVTSSNWTIGDTIRTCRRFYQSLGGGQDRGIKYIRGDTLIDVKTNDFQSNRGLSIIAEGDIAIRGTEPVSLIGRWGTGTTDEPSLATQNGDIISPDVPAVPGGGNIEEKRMNNRYFGGFIYSENGDVRFNYLRNDYNGTFGNNIILSGRVQLQKQGSRWGWWRWGWWRRWWRRWHRNPSGGFDFEPVIIQWQEQ
jgi:hypothetical protein